MSSTQTPRRKRSSSINNFPVAFITPILLRPSFRKNSVQLPNHKTNLSSPFIICASLSSSNQTTQYVPLHVHSDFSLLDGASQLPALVKRAEELNVPALALTDHGVLYGAVQLVRMCQSTSVKPIIGNEMYTVNAPLPHEQDPSPENRVKRYHLIVLAKNTIGYQNLVKLTSLAHLDGVVGKGIFARPCVNKDLLYQYREGLIVSSACLGGEIPQAILNDDIEKARETAKWFRDTFGEDFYLEIQDHGSEEDKKVNPAMVQLSRELGIKVIATNDSHFTNCLDAEAHDALICIQTGKMLSDENRLRYAGNEYFKSVDEMRECFIDHLDIKDVDRALQNTLNVANKVSTYDLFGETRIPDFPVPKSFNLPHDAYLRHVSKESLEERLQARINSGLVDPSRRKEYESRLELELDMLCKMGFASYFLVVWDYIRYAKEVGIPVGPGRGSAAGSLVAFALRITDVDPIPFNLLFERFLNPERKSMPDIDTDFSVAGRERIIQYVTERYGEDRVAQIITFNRLTSKAVLKDVARVHQVPYSEADRLAKLIPVVRGKPATLTQLMSKDTPSPEFKQVVERNVSYNKWFDKAKRIEGTNKTYGIHAAGVVISAHPLTDIVPLSKAKHGETITQYAMEDVESLGLLKMDFLGLKNLSVIETALEFINEGRRQCGTNDDLEFEVDTLPLDDAKTYKLLAEGELDGIFQLDASAGMRNIVRDFRPSNLEDISSILALYRPGPLDAGLIPKFIRRKHGLDPIEYDHPLLKPILKETYGIMVYQEQIMRIARDLAGYSLGEADILRRAMGKKKTKDMEREKPKFIAGAEERGIPKTIATSLFDQMIKFAEYCFNKSHSTAYAYLTYQTAYLKANYPVEYSAALLRSNMNQSDKLVRYLADANISGVKLLPPDVNKSDLGFTVDRSSDEGSVVLFGLEAVKTVGGSVGKALIEEREARGPFKSVIDLIERVNLRVLNKRAMGALIRAGAFDKLHRNRKVLLQELDSLLALRRRLRDKKKQKAKKQLSEEEILKLEEAQQWEWKKTEIQLGQKSNNEPDFSTLEKLAGEKATMGFYASGHPLYDLQPVRKVLDCTKIVDIVGQDDSDNSIHDEGLASGTGVMVLSCISDLKNMTTAKGKKMAKWMIEDATSRVAGIVFPNSYDIMQQVLPNKQMETETSTETDNSSDNQEESEESSSLVVENDARVIVWGTVDRESSGTSQVIIDDVQRVDDVSAVFATASYREGFDFRTHMTVLNKIVAKVLEVDDSPNTVTYMDANGELQTRRKNRSVPLSKKNRIPLILKCLDAEGNVTSYRYAGNRLRFPTECSKLLSLLAESNGYKFSKHSISKEIQDGDIEQVAIEDSVEYSEHQVSNTDVVTEVQESEPKFTDVAALDLDQNTLSKDEEEAVTSPENTSDQVSKIPIGVFEDETYSREYQEQELVAAMQKKEDRGISSEFARVASQQMFVRNQSNIHIPKLQLEQFSKHHDFNTSEDTVGIKKRSRAANTTTSSLTAESRQEHVSSYSTTGTAVRPPTQRQIHDSNSALYTRIAEMGSADTTTQPRLNDSLKTKKVDEPPSINNDPEKDDSQQGSPFSTGKLEESKNKTVRDTAEPAVHRDNVHEIQTTEKNEPLTEYVDDDEVFDLSEGLYIDIDSYELGGLLDGICLMASHIASEYATLPCSVVAMSGIDIAKLNESNVSIHVSGRVAFVKDEHLYVHVDLRESKPSGKRKRVRSFGPAVVVLSCDSALPAMTLKTKKAKKSLETAQQKIAIVTETAEASSGSKSGKALSGPPKKKLLDFKSSESGLYITKEWNDDIQELDRSNDGGEILSAMTRAAEIASENVFNAPEKLHVVGMDQMFVKGPAHLVFPSSVSIRVHFASLSFSSIKLQVEASILSSRSEQTSYRATFTVESSDSSLLKGARLEVDEDYLFSNTEVQTCFMRHKENLCT